MVQGVNSQLQGAQTDCHQTYAIVALASSAGGLNALGRVLAGLPADFPIPIVVVQHLDPRHRSLMAEILSHHTALTVRQAQHDDQLRPGTAYIAPPDHHMLVDSAGRLALTDTARVHFVRPSADLLFESVAASYRQRAIAVVLTGTGSDGALGIAAVKRLGGTVIAQSQGSAEFFGMPGAAIETGSVDYVLPLEEIAGTLVALVKEGCTQ